ncbi:MAG: hypothetical protein QW177_06340 [Candidatus Nitrosotenuis sp.]|nr:hypothetical protein [Candidatus Nitrosotenuis sp.]
MRVDLCRKCGIELKEYSDSETCQVCGRDYAQFRCNKCGMVTEPQYHIHSVATCAETQ